ncbi:maltose ABC transporter permease MalF [Leucothrix pacifica]|uniref:Maltose/maltodextrin transport system permease protein n=1 Tax=Leucothrix pacifica TaxID=1247513 RepID=A0A317CNZ9_9GAMM|nr:maltose ABC transporter permease MalF [Leucothrix pacifica]PWQ98060.1 maltose ABC transporter permease MalF [Leucothrix pacifica]
MSSVHPFPLQPRVPFGKYLLKWSALLFSSLILLYIVSIIYLTGYFVLAFITLVIYCLTLYVYLHKPLTAYRYLLPGLIGISVFVIFPLVHTINMGLTNFSSSNLLDYQRAKQYFLDERYISSDNQLAFTLHKHSDGYQLKLSGEDKVYTSPPISLGGPQQITLREQDENSSFTLGDEIPMGQIIKLRESIKQLNLTLPSGQQLGMQGLRRFAMSSPLYKVFEGETLINTQTNAILTPNFDTGFFEDENKKRLTPGFKVSIGLDNYYRIFGSADFQEPFIKIFLWTVVFSALTVLFTLVIGVLLAVLLNWDALRFRTLYRTLLFLPYAVPGFISILVFKGLFNENFGEINLILNSLFGISPGWFSDPTLAKVMLVLVNTWLGYPYIMILCTGLLKSISGEIYEATAIEGCSPLRNFWSITLPLIIKPLSPLLVASFAFNFNNFVLISLLTGGRPDFLDSQVPAGTTDILVTYTYRIAFEDSGQNFGLAAAISTIIFVMVAIMSVINLRMARVNESGRKP